jgi:hypothetical protein
MGNLLTPCFIYSVSKPWRASSTESPTEVTLPASCSTRVECVRVCEGALYKSKRICTPLLGLYAADGSSLGGVEGLLNGDVLLYRYLFFFLTVCKC